MASDFTPPLGAAAVFYNGAAWPVGIELYEDGDPVDEAGLRPDIETMIEADEHLRYRVNEIDRVSGGRLDVAESRLGFTFPVDTLGGVDWTDSGGLVVSVITSPTDRTLLLAMNDIDVVLDAQRTRLDVLVPRVMPGGDIAGPFPPYPTAPTFFGPTADHHTAISSLDVQLVATDATATAASAAAAANTTSITNLEDKLGVGAAGFSGPFDFSFNYVVGDDDLETVTNRVDQELFGLAGFASGIVHAVAFGGGNGNARAISDFSDSVTFGGFNAGASSATIVLEEKRIVGPGTAVIQLPVSSTDVRLVWEPLQLGVVVRGNSNDGVGAFASFDWNTITAIPDTGLGGNWYFEFDLPTADHYIHFVIYYD